MAIKSKINEEKSLMECIDNYSDIKKQTALRYGSGNNAFEIEINTKIGFDEINNNVALLADIVNYDGSLSEFDYELMDELMPYLLIKTFTNIPIPTRVEKFEDGEETTLIDYEKCLEICSVLDLKNSLALASPVVAECISIMERNAWRRLEIKKELMIHNEQLNALNEFYKVLDDLQDVVDSQPNITQSELDEFVSQISEANKEAAKLNNLLAPKSKSKIALAENVPQDVVEDNNNSN